MNGYEVLKAQQREPELASVPVIVISNSGQPVEINRALMLGVKDYVVKTQFDPEEVITKVRLQLSKDGESVQAANAEDEVSSSTSAPSSRDPELSGKKIMWVEDDKFLSDIIARKLSSQGCTLLHTTAGEEALQLLQRERPDLILLDVLLPGINGFDILKRIKADPNVRKYP